MLNYKEITARLPFDISVEALAGELLENHEALSGSSQIMVRPLGHLNRVAAREVQEVTGAHFDAEGQEVIYIDINREGLFDALPEMLFIRQNAVYEDEVEKAQHLARQQTMARQFLLPFEEAFYRARIDLERAERSAIQGLAASLLELFGLDQSAVDANTREQLLSFALFMPFLDRIAGNLDLTGRLLEVVLRKPVAVTCGGSPQYPIPEAQQPSLAEATLGVDMMLGGLFSDGIAALLVTVSGLSPGEVEGWLPGGQQRSLVEELLVPHLLSAGEQVELSIEIGQSAEGLLLGEDQGRSILGYTTTLHNVEC